MAYYTARQQENGKWYYTCQNGDMVLTMDCCKNCGGHESEHGALECRRLHNIKTSRIRWNDEAQHKCAICKTWTQTCRIVDADFPKEYYLCAEHNNIENLDILTKPEEKKVAKKILQKPDIYVPQTFEEAVDILIAGGKPVSDPMNHLSGMAIRNDWGLWHNATPLAKWFTEKKLFHGDDRSGLLDSAVEAKIKGKPFDVDAEIKRYQEWWVNQYGEKYNLDKVEKDFHEYALTEADYA